MNDCVIIQSQSANLKKIREFTRNFLSTDTLTLPLEEREELVLAIDEACQNVVRHAYKDKTGDLAIKLSFKDNEFIVTLEDDGTPVIPEKIKPRNLDDVKPGGLGTFFINQIMDSVSFQLSSPHWTNCLIMKKQIK